jgi:low temperature requirement protein LtrA
VAANRVSTLELFFDLVFVFTITQIALIIEHEPSWSSVAQAALELLVIFWMYGGFAWLTNTLAPRHHNSGPSSCSVWPPSLWCR